jgi:hypothetical protein
VKNVKVKMAERLEFLDVRNVFARYVKFEGTKPAVFLFSVHCGMKEVKLLIIQELLEEFILLANLFCQ